MSTLSVLNGGPERVPTEGRRKPLQWWQLPSMSEVELAADLARNARRARQLEQRGDLDSYATAADLADVGRRVNGGEDQ